MELMRCLVVLNLDVLEKGSTWLLLARQTYLYNSCTAEPGRGSSYVGSSSIAWRAERDCGPFLIDVELSA